MGALGASFGGYSTHPSEPFSDACARSRHDLLTATARSSDFAAAPARGLTLVSVDYPADTELAERNRVTRDMRTSDEVG